MRRKMVIIAEEFAQTEEAYEIFRRRGWAHVDDQSVPLAGKKQVRKEEFDTPQIKLDIEEWEYGDQDQ